MAKLSEVPADYCWACGAEAADGKVIHDDRCIVLNQIAWRATRWPEGAEL